MKVQRLFQEIGVIMIGFTLYESIYGSWSPIIANYITMNVNEQAFDYWRMAFVLIICCLVAGILQLYHRAIDKSNDYLLFIDDLDDIKVIGYIIEELKYNPVGLRILMFVEYVIVLGLLAICSVLLLGYRQAFCLTIGMLFVLDFRKIVQTLRITEEVDK